MNQRSANILAILVPLALILFFFGGMFLENYLKDPVRAARSAARPVARELAREIQNDVRFTNIEVGVFDMGDKGPLYVRGGVQTKADSDELHRMLDSLHPPPASVDWMVHVSDKSEMNHLP